MGQRRYAIILLAITAALLCPATVGANPIDVYQDFVTDGTLSCGHSHRDLVTAASDPSLNQYGNPLTMEQLAVAANSMLANGCRGGQAANGGGGGVGAGGSSGTSGTTGHGGSHGSAGGGSGAGPAVNPASPGDLLASQRSGSRSADTSTPAWQLLLLAGLVLAAALAAGRWLRRRASQS